jgi:predicted ATPase/DNA-binding SARP family transcriptional activator
VVELNLLFLGQPRIELGGKPVTLRRRKVLGLLAYLAVGSRAHTRDELAELMYPDLARGRAYADLRQSLSYLRDSLGTRRLESGPHGVSLADAKGLAVDVHEFRRLIKRTKPSEQRTADDTGLAQLARAARLYRGPFLSGFYLKDSPGFEQWQAGEEESLRREQSSLLERLVEACRRRGETEPAIEWARAAVDLDPLEENSHRRLMSVLAAAGRRSEALRQYERCRSLLAESLDTVPDDETDALRAGIVEGRIAVEIRPAQPGRRCEPAPADTVLLLASSHDTGAEEEYRVAFTSASTAIKAALKLVKSTKAPAAHDRGRTPVGARTISLPGVAIHTADQGGREAAWKRASALLRAAPRGQVVLSDDAAELCLDRLPPGASLRPLGSHLLDDLGPPLHIFRLAHPGISPRFPRLRTLDGRPGNLRPQSTPLVGRDRELDILSTLLKDDSVRVLTLTGTGGTGKTRLALHAAARRSLTFDDGAYFVDLAALHDPAHVITAISAAVGLRESPGDPRPRLEVLLDTLGHRRMVLLLDTFEHLIPAASVVGAIADACADVKLIVTSRQALHLRSEKEYPVPSLSLPGAGATFSVDSQAPCDAVSLFVERARAADPGFALTVENAPAVAAICNSLDGLPLAIELAAPWIKVLPAPVLLERLTRRLQLLNRGSGDLPERQRTLRGEIAWSHDLLEPDEQRLFRRLAVFPGSFALEAAEAVCPGPRTLDLLASLVDKSLLRRERPDGDPRFRTLQTIREFASEQLDASGEAKDVRDGFQAWALCAAETAAGHLYGGEQAAWFDRLEADHDNHRHALVMMFDQRRASEGTRMAAALGWFWFRRGRFTVGAEWLERFLSLRDETVDAGVRARAHYHLAWMRLMLGGTFTGNTEARERFRVALALSEESRDRPGEALCLSWLAWCADDLPMAERCTMADRGVAIAREAAGPWVLSFCLKLAHSFLPRNDEPPAQSIAALDEAIRLARQTADPFLIAQALHGMGDVYHNQRDEEAAEPWYLESLEIATQIDDTWSAFDARSHLAWGCLNRGDIARASRSFAEALRAAAESGARVYITQFLNGLATIARQQGEAVRAVRLGGAASALRYHGNTGWDPRLAGETGLARSTVEKEWSAGRAMSLDEAVRYALDGFDGGTASAGT